MGWLRWSKGQTIDGIYQIALTVAFEGILFPTPTVGVRRYLQVGLQIFNRDPSFDGGYSQTSPIGETSDGSCLVFEGRFSVQNKFGIKR